ANREGAAAPNWIGALPIVGDWLTNYWNENLANPHDLGELVQLFSGEHIGNIYRWLLALSGKAFSLVLTLLFMLITLFFIYKDGVRLVAQVDKVGDRILPVHWQRFSRVVPATVSSTVTGMGLIALGEGVVLGLAYAIAGVPSPVALGVLTGFMALIPGGADRKSTRLNSSHVKISYAVFCLKKKTARRIRVCRPPRPYATIACLVLLIRRPPWPALFPYTTLFRSPR